MFAIITDFYSNPRRKHVLAIDISTVFLFIEQPW